MQNKLIIAIAGLTLFLLRNAFATKTNLKHYVTKGLSSGVSERASE